MGAENSIEGYHVIDVSPNSPADTAGLTSYLDIILSANGVRLNSGPGFVDILTKSNQSRVFLRVFNILTEKTRETTVIPDKEWGGEGMLGSTVRFESWKPNEGNVHVMKVFENSPAKTAGLIELQDYILGTDDITIPTIDYLSKAIANKEQVNLFVFNSVKKAVRKVPITINPNWGGQGSLGCDIADGYMHKMQEADAYASNPETTIATEEEVIDGTPEKILAEEIREVPYQENYAPESVAQDWFGDLTSQAQFIDEESSMQAAQQMNSGGVHNHGAAEKPSNLSDDTKL